MPKTRVTTDELAKTFRIWLTVIGQRRSALLRDLWTRRGEDHDSAKIEHARSELARELAENLHRNRWDVMREEQFTDQFDLRAGKD